MYVKKLVPDAKLPLRATDGSAGYDLYAIEDGIIYPKNKSIISTGISISLPKITAPYDIYGSIRSRSGLSARHNIEVGAGVIDKDYQDEIKIILYNHSNIPFEYKKYDRIAQLVLEIIITPPVLWVEDNTYNEDNSITMDELTQEKIKRIGGFGSTGI